MKRNIFKSLILCLTIVSVFQASAQGKKDDKTKAFLNFTFEDLVDGKETEVSDAGMIYMVKGLGISSFIPADLFHAADDFGVNLNLYGFAKPIDPKTERFEGGDEKLFATTKEDEAGNNTYAGIITHKPGKLSSERSYVTIPFLDKNGKNKITMVEGKTYCIEMSISMAEASKYATNNIGFMFVENVDGYKFDLPTFESWDEITQRGSYVFQNNPNVVYNYKNKVYDSYGGWDKVCNTYKATSSKINGLIIGNFSSFDPKLTKVINQSVKKKIEDGADEVALEPMAYYYVDNIRIKEVANRGECNCFKQDTSAASVEFSKVVISKEPIIDEDLSEAENLEAQVIYYGFGEKSLDESGKRCLEMLVKYLKGNPTHSVEIISHNDKLEDSLAREYEEFRDVLENLDLKRAEFIQGFVSERYEINKNRIIPVERNADEPNVSEYDQNQVQLSEEEIELRLAYDRRVTFKIIKK
jgi:outer membrane protein OmpA-like peptidoglycan-associated protein